MQAHLIGRDLINGKGESFPADEILKDKVIGLYFSANWCPPCQTFTAKLTEFVKELKADNKPFEVVFVSSDQSEKKMMDYMAPTPFYAIPFRTSTLIEEITDEYDIMGIPALVIVKNGKLVTLEGRADVTTKGKAAFDEWLKAPTSTQI
jgi:nucleoredoxin